MKFCVRGAYLLRVSLLLSECDAAFLKVISKSVDTEKVTRHHENKTGTQSPRRTLLLPQMYLAAVSEEATGEMLHGKKEWSQLGGEQWEDFFFSISV